MNGWDEDIWDDDFMNKGRRSPRGGTDWVDPRRTNGKYSHPYSYDAFYHWREKNIKTAHAEYHDRMQQWNWEKYEEARELVKGKWFHECTREELSAFLSAYHDKPVKAVALVEGCNVSSGYPYWVFYFRDVT